MESLSKSFFHAHGTRLKIAYAQSLVQILHPIGKVCDFSSVFVPDWLKRHYFQTAQAEVNHPGWAKAIDIIYPKAREMLAKPRYFGVAYPLAISALCVAPQDFFAKNWMACIDLSVAKMKVACFTYCRDYCLDFGSPLAGEAYACDVSKRDPTHHMDLLVPMSRGELYCNIKAGDCPQAPVPT